MLRRREMDGGTVPAGEVRNVHDLTVEYGAWRSASGVGVECAGSDGRRWRHGASRGSEERAYFDGERWWHITVPPGELRNEHVPTFG